MTTPFLKNHISVFLAMTLCCLIGHSASAQAQSVGATPLIAKHKGEQATTHLLPYPFLGTKTQNIVLSGNAASNEADTATINMLEFWERQTSPQDQHHLAKQALTEYILYVQQRLNTTRSKTNMPQPKKGDDQQNRRLQYPFPWATTCHIHLPSGIPSTRSDVLIIDMREYWEYQVSQQDKQNLSKRPFGDYIKYIREHLNKPHP